MSGKLEIQWAPINKKFITWGADINLYQIHHINKESGLSGIPESQLCKISETHLAQLVATSSNHHYVRSIDIYPKCNEDILLAVGLANGRVALTTFGPSEYDIHGYPGKEFVPKHGRHCNAVLFNPIECNLIAAGLEKYRSDSSVLIWDINKFVVNNDTSNSTRMMVNTMAPAVELVKPVAEFGTSEVTYSLAWFYSSSKVLACGMNGKSIKIYDLRDPNKMMNSTLTKAVYGICVNRNDDRQIASYFENQVCVWDTRNFEKPVVILPQNKHVSKIGWCPTKQNCLSTLQKDSSVLNLYNIQQTVVSSEEVEPTVMERVITPGSPHNITSFSWHNSDENRLLTIALSGAIKDYTVFDRIAIAWSASSSFVWSCGSKVLRVINDVYLDDISYKIKERAKARYGLQEEFRKNAEYAEDDLKLCKVWNWLQLTENLTEEGILKDMEYKHPGVLHILNKIDSVTNKSEQIAVPWAELGYPKSQSSVIYYKHPDREKGLHLCGWPLNMDSSTLTKFVTCLEKSGAYCRAAAIAVFNLNIQLAIEVLCRASDENQFGSSLNVAALALAGFSDDRSKAWRQNCISCIEKLTNPYLKAMFSFLTADSQNYDSAIIEKGIAVDDRVALACLYLPDEKISKYMEKLSSELCKAGDLYGLLVTGNSKDGLNILQTYLDHSSDIQSTTLIAVRAFSDYLGNDTVQNWIVNYRDLLNTWRMYLERADFDIMLAQIKSREKPLRQVYISCNYCGKSVSASMQGFNQERGQYQRASSSTPVKMSCCPNCRKPLPRCAICLMYMGTTTTKETDSTQMVAFGNWFSWCQSCRHGGHAEHISKWFIEHQECPVSGCFCRCFSLDGSVIKN